MSCPDGDDQLVEVSRADGEETGVGSTTHWWQRLHRCACHLVQRPCHPYLFRRDLHPVEASTDVGFILSAKILREVHVEFLLGSKREFQKELGYISPQPDVPFASYSMKRSM